MGICDARGLESRVFAVGFYGISCFVGNTCLLLRLDELMGRALPLTCCFKDLSLYAMVKWDARAERWNRTEWVYIWDSLLLLEWLYLYQINE